VIAGPYGYGRSQPLVERNPNPGKLVPLPGLVQVTGDA
jgi:hypothetical protein